MPDDCAEPMERVDAIIKGLAGLTGAEDEIVMQESLAREEFARAIEQADVAARAQAFEEAAQLVEQVAKNDDISDLGDACSDAFNSGSMKRSMTERLADYSRILADGIRALAAKPQS